jgi:hypothetical protein
MPIVARVVRNLDFATPVAHPHMPTQRCRATLDQRIHRRKLLRRAVVILQIFVEMDTEDIGHFQRWLDSGHIDQCA